MKNILSFLLFTAFGIAAIYLYLLWQKQTVLTRILPPSVTQGNMYSFSLDKAPKNALNGAISRLEGTVKWSSRTATVPAILQRETRLQQGEDVETGSDGRVSFAFGSVADIALQSDSRVEITQTLPENIVLRQTAGDATYTSALSPVSVRIMHLILLANGGTFRVAEDSETGEITVRAVKGTVSLGYNDLNYQSITEKLQEGDVYVYDDTSRTGTVE